MTEFECLATWNYQILYQYISTQKTTRRLRLLMVACCRTQSEHFFDPFIHAAVSLAEECADIPAIERALEIVHEYVTISLWPPANPSDDELRFHQILSGVEHLLAVQRGLFECR